MGALADISDLVNRATGGNSGSPENIWWNKTHHIAGAAGVALAAGKDTSLWMFDGQPGGAPLPPTTATAPDHTTDGGLKQTNPSGGRQKWLTSFGNSNCYSQASFLLYDRLLHVSGLSGTVSTPQTVGGAITRYTGAEAWGNQAWVEIYTAVGNTGRNTTINYTDDAGNAQTSGIITVGSSVNQDIGRVVPFPLASGGHGVRAVADVTLVGSTTLAGDFGITIARPLAWITVNQVGGGSAPVTYLEQLAEIKSGACLALLLCPHVTANYGSMGGYISTVEA